MLPATTQRQIYQSISALEAGEYAVQISWADIADVRAMLDAADIAVTLRLSADVVDGEYTSHTMYAGVTDYQQDSQTQKIHQYRRCTLNISVHAKDAQIGGTPISATDVIDEYIETLQIWAMSSLRGIVSIIEDAGTLDLTYLADNSQRRDMALYLRYEQAMSATVPNIADVDAAISIR